MENEPSLAQDATLLGMLDRTESIEFLGIGADAVTYRMVASGSGATVILRYTFPLAETLNVRVDVAVARYREQSALFINKYAQWFTRRLPLQVIPSERQIADFLPKKHSLRMRLGAIDRASGDSPNQILVQLLEDAGMELAQSPFADEVDLYDFRCFFFEFFHGLWVARTLSGSFTHGDIHVRNMTVSERPDNKRRRYYYINNVEFVLESPFQLHLIDYDTMDWPGRVITKDVHEGLSALKLYGNVLIEREHRNKVSNALVYGKNTIHKLDGVNYADNTRDIETLLLKNDFFAPLRSLPDEPRKRQRRGEIERCIQCFGRADFAVGGYAGRYVCDATCNTQYHVGHLFRP